MTPYQQTVPQFQRTLTTMGKMFDKAEAVAKAKNFDVNVFLSLRLAPDMYSLVKQVQVTCDMAKGSTARLAGKEPPKHEDNEKTLDELRARVKKTLDYLATFKPDDLEDCEDRRVDIPWAPGKYMHGADYINEMALPNFYFHAAATYAILRHNGVDLSKGDFVGNINIKG